MGSTELAAEDLRIISRQTVGHYDESAESFWEGTRDHDVMQNVQALLDAIAGEGPHIILDFGCGPGRDLMTCASIQASAFSLPTSHINLL